MPVHPTPAVAVPPTGSGRAHIAQAPVSPPTMPHCLVHATAAVQSYFLRKGVRRAQDVAGWWRHEGEVQATGARLGWSEADLQGAVVTWSESRRSEIQDLPPVPAPAGLGLASAPIPKPLSGTGVSVCQATLAPVVLNPQRDKSAVRGRLWRIYVALGARGDCWDDCMRLQTTCTVIVQRGSCAGVARDCLSSGQCRAPHSSLRRRST